MTQPPPVPPEEPTAGSAVPSQAPGTPTLLELIAGMEAALVAYDPAGAALLTEGARIEATSGLLRLQNRLNAITADHLHHLETDQVCWHHLGISTSTWLAAHEQLTPRQAVRMIKQGKDLARFGAIRQGAMDGDISITQAVAVTQSLADLPGELESERVDAAEQHMLTLCRDYNSRELAGLSEHLVEVIAPDIAEALGRERVERQLQRARRDRYLQFCDDGHGTTRIRGALPTLQARLIETVLGSFAAAEHRRGIDNPDPYQAMSTRPQRLADALVTMCGRIEYCAEAPAHGGDRPRIVVTITHDRLLDWNDSAGGHEIGNHHRLTPGELRRLACDADLLPVILGGDSEILDVGVLQRLVTPAIRAALTIRDRGCIFPGCDKLPVDCEAHHINPWQNGGATALANLVLLCKHHHGTVEPATNPEHRQRQWKIELHPRTGVPQAIPPAHHDPNRRPRRHNRFTIRR